MPQERAEKRRPKVVISAKVAAPVGEIVRNAAVILGWPTSRVVEEGALLRAQQILEQAQRAYAKVRRAIRSDKATKAALARHAKK